MKVSTKQLTKSGFSSLGIFLYKVGVFKITEAPGKSLDAYRPIKVRIVPRMWHPAFLVVMISFLIMSGVTGFKEAWKDFRQNEEWALAKDEDC